MRGHEPADAVAAIEQGVHFMDQSRAPPPGLAIGEDFDVGTIHAALTHPLRYCLRV